MDWGILVSSLIVFSGAVAVVFWVITNFINHKKE